MTARTPFHRFVQRRIVAAADDPWGPGARARGQAGLTLVEMIVVVATGTIVILPVFAIMFLTVGQKEPNERSNAQDAQIRVVRTTLTKDWGKAMLIRTNAFDSSSLPANAPPAVTFANTATVVGECNQGNLTSFATPDTDNPSQPWTGPDNEVVGPIIAIQTGTEPYLGLNASGQEIWKSGRLRIIYSLVRSDDPSQGSGEGGLQRGPSYDLIRRTCTTKGPVAACSPPGPPPVANAQEDSGCWRIDSIQNSINDEGGSQTLIARGIRGFSVAETCNPPSTAPPYTPCDAKITITGEFGKRVTLNLYQQAWRCLRSTGPTTTSATPTTRPQNC
jgi:hypothetical protein